MSITVIKPGLQSSLQDLGRYGYQHLGVPVSGAMDTRAHRLANLMAGNTDDCATLEVTLTGPTLAFHITTCIAISGAALSPTINSHPVPNNRPIIVKAGDQLAFGRCQNGLRAYVAVTGGFAVPPVMGSASTYLRGGFGGLQGRALRADDQLSVHETLTTNSPQVLADKLWQIKLYLPAILGLGTRSDVRTIRGPHANLYTPESLAALFGSEYRIEPESERMGYRLKGPTLAMTDPQQLLSEATSFGAIQVPPDGMPIILMADRQTTGGYPKVGHVCTADLPLVAQSAPGQTLTLQEISLARAQQLDNQREEAFGRLSQNLQQVRDALAPYRNKL